MSELLASLASGKTVCTVEFDPPKGADPTELLDRIRQLRGRIDAVNLTDCAMAHVRMSAIALAHLVSREGIEPIIHVTCRDRNVIGLQSELLGAAALGITHLLALSGDPPSRGDHPEARPVFELDTIGLIRLTAALNRGETHAGTPLAAPTRFVVAAAGNPGADDLEVEADKLEAKVEAGARFVQTQPIFDPSLAERFQEGLARRRLEVPVLYGIMPLRSLRSALYMRDHVPGMRVPAEVVQQFERADEEATGVRIAAELVRSLWGRVAGLHLFPMNRPHVVLELLDGADGPSRAGA